MTLLSRLHPADSQVQESADAQRYDGFHLFLRDETIPGETGFVCRLVYSKGKTFLYYKGNLRAQIDGADFASAYFGIWLSEYSISQKLRKDLLGIRR